MLNYVLIALLVLSGCTRQETSGSNRPVRGAVHDDILSITPGTEVWVQPGGKVAFSVTTDVPQATLKWERSANANYQFEAPALDYPCQVKVEKTQVTLSQGTNGVTRGVTIRVQNNICLIDESTGLTSNDTTKLLIGKDKALYIGTRNGLTRFKDGRIKKELTGANNEPLQVITALAEADDYILVGKARKFLAYPMRGFGLDRVSFRDDGGETRAFWQPQTKFASSFVSGVFFNPNRSQPFPEVLTAQNYTTGGGVISSSSSRFEDQSGPILAGESIYAALEVGHQTFFGGDGGIFVVEGGAQVHRYDGSDWGGKGGLFGVGSNRSVRALAMDSTGTVWIGLNASTFEKGGLMSFKPGATMNNGTWSNIATLDGAGNDVRALIVDERDTLWIATNNGLVRRDINGAKTIYNANARKGKPNQPALPSDDIRDLAYDAESRNLWIATSNGVARWSLALLK